MKNEKSQVTNVESVHTSNPAYQNIFDYFQLAVPLYCLNKAICEVGAQIAVDYFNLERLEKEWPLTFFQ